MGGITATGNHDIETIGRGQAARILHLNLYGCFTGPTRTRININLAVGVEADAGVNRRRILDTKG